MPVRISLPYETPPDFDPRTNALCLQRWYRHPLLGKHRKTIAAAIFLFLLGIVFLALGVWAVLDHNSDYIIPFFVICGLTIIPGGYQTFYIIRVFREDEGYHFDEIPSYDDDTPR